MSRNRDREGLDLNDIASLIAATRPPAAHVEERGLAKHAATIVVAIILALCLWVGASVSSLGTIVTRMSANVDALQRVLPTSRRARVRHRSSCPIPKRPMRARTPAQMPWKPTSFV
ncbi:hypothetical protein QP162_12545 [Sphingomonas aurantiaca]|uniref:hypothetical protein n=1 Tax=Sphingomonas aurantiaca TaxID=185949 RepID=UPI002FE0232A